LSCSLTLGMKVSCGLRKKAYHKGEGGKRPAQGGSSVLVFNLSLEEGVIPNPAQFSRPRDLAWSFLRRITGTARKILPFA